MTESPNDEVGPSLAQSGTSDWVSIEDAIAKAQVAGLVLGDTCHHIQDKDGKVSFHGPVVEGQEKTSGDTCWRFALQDAPEESTKE